MPFVRRKIHPVHLARQPSSWGVTQGGEEVTLNGEYDLTAVTNVTLCNALHQLASLVLIAEDIQSNLDKELQDLSSRFLRLTAKVDVIQREVLAHDPRMVPVPESDMRSFSERVEYFRSRELLPEPIFTVQTRPREIQSLYEDAAETPVLLIRDLDMLRNDGRRSSGFFTCVPILGNSLKKHKLNLDIETRRPASFVALPDWCLDDETSERELDLAPVSPSVPSRAPTSPHPFDRKLPQPEQRLRAISSKYPPKVITIDVSGRGFRRMELFRRSLLQFEYVKSKRRRRRLKRRNTIADAREVRSALKQKSLPSTSSGKGYSSPKSGLSSYTDRSFDTTVDTTSTKTSSEKEPKPHPLGLEVGIPTPRRNAILLSSTVEDPAEFFNDEELANDSGVSNFSPREFRKKLARRKALWSANNTYQGFESPVPEGYCLQGNKQLPLGPGKTSTPKAPSVPISYPGNVKFSREGSSRDEGTRSSSGNWSASSSPRTSLDLDNNNHLLNPLSQPPSKDADEEEKSQGEIPFRKIESDSIDLESTLSPSSSFDQDSFISDSYPIRSTSPSSNHRPYSRTTDDYPSLSSRESDGTLTPTQDIQDIPFADDDTSSAFSCDAEGYYTSFHIDSGLRSSVSYEGDKLASESEADLFGRGSTGTTNSSASLGTVIMRNPDKKTPPRPPQRVSSLERKENRESIITVIHLNGSSHSSREEVGGAEGSEKSTGRDSQSSKETDSGRETSSSPLDSASPRQPATGETDLESDMENVEKKTNFKLKTTISASGIPSLCVITPPLSDDENIRSRDGNSESNVQRKIQNFQAQTSAGSKNVSVPPPTSARQPGDGAVAPSLPSTSLLSNSPQIPSLTVMSQKRADSASQFRNFLPKTESQPTTASKPQGDQLSLGRSVSERRAEIQLKVLGEKKPSSDVLIQKQNFRDSSQDREIHSVVAYRELQNSSGQPVSSVSSVPSSVKETVVITPTNSLERRKANSKSGAHVVLDSEGKILYSSANSIQSKNVQTTTFEPGPYIKPPPIAGSSSLGKPKIVSSIQSMPLPPVPPIRESTLSSAVEAKRSLKVEAQTTSTPQQPKLGTRSQINAQSSNLSGLSAHIQPRSQVNSIKSSNLKNPRTVSVEGSKAGEEEPQKRKRTVEGAAAGKDRDRIPPPVSQRRYNTLGRESASKLSEAKSKDMEGLQYLSLQRPSSQKHHHHQQDAVTLQYQQVLQNQQIIQKQKKAAQDKLVKQENNQQQKQSTHHILQQQQIELQRQLHQQQMQLQQHKALKEAQARKESQILVSNDASTSLLQTRQDLHRQQLLQLQQQHLDSLQQQSLYQTQDDQYRNRTFLQQEDALQAMGPSEVLLATQGTTIISQNQRGYLPDQGLLDPAYPGRSQQATYIVAPTARAPTPIQGLSSSSPQRLPGNLTALQQQNLQIYSGLAYGTQLGVQSYSMATDGRGTPIPRTLSISPPPYEQYNLTNSDIYGRIGMTRQVQVGGTLPSGFGRNQLNYRSLPPNLRQPLTPSEVLAHQSQGRVGRHSHGSQLVRRASVAGTETVDLAKSNPNTPEKYLDKKEKTSKRDKERRKKEVKTEKSPKKKWFWTLPLGRKKKAKDNSADDDDGGFKDASQKSVRKLAVAENTSFIRYPSPDTGTSEANTSLSSDLSSGEQGYRSSPSSEVYYYSQRAQTLQHQQHILAAARAGMITGPIGIIPGTNSLSAAVPRSQPTTPVSPEAQGILSVDSDMTDLTRNRKYMSRDEMYSAMRHPQYSNKRNSLPGSLSGITAEFSQSSTPSSSRSNSPAVFGINPPPSYVVRPQAREGSQIISNEPANLSSSDRLALPNEVPTSNSKMVEDSLTKEIQPPAGYREILAREEQLVTDYQDDPSSASGGSSSSRVTKQTTLIDFKKMILEQSMNSAGGREKISAVEMLRASRPSIYGYSLPPPPIVKLHQESPGAPKGEGVIIPPNSRNTARALLFQSRFGSGRRFRSAKTEIISTTILEDNLEDEASKLYDDGDYTDEEDLSSSTTSSQEKRTVAEGRDTLVKTASEADSEKSSDGLEEALIHDDMNGDEVPLIDADTSGDSGTPEVNHSTPNKSIDSNLPQPDVSVVMPGNSTEVVQDGHDSDQIFL